MTVLTDAELVSVTDVIMPLSPVMQLRQPFQMK